MEQPNQVLCICMHIQYALFEGIINGTLEFTLPGRIGEYCRQLCFYVVGVYGVRELPGTSVLVLLRFPRNAIFAQIRRSAGARWINTNLLTAFRNGSIKQQKCKYSFASATEGGEGDARNSEVPRLGPAKILAHVQHLLTSHPLKS